jgi:hypothetical protein
VSALDWSRITDIAYGRTTLSMTYEEQQAVAHKLVMLNDLPLCSLQIGPDGWVPGNTEEALAGWHAEAGRLRAENIALLDRLVALESQFAAAEQRGREQADGKEQTILKLMEENHQLRLSAGCLASSITALKAALPEPMHRLGDLIQTVSAQHSVLQVTLGEDP